jgi:5'-AMP-activated protein kinase regulatory gamma subunit
LLLVSCSISAIVSQSDVVSFLHKHVEQLGPLADVTVAQLGLADKAVVCVPGEMSAIHAFASMAVRAANAV